MRIYSVPPLTAYYRWDTGALVSTFPIGYSSSEVTQYETSIDSNLAEFVEQTFDDLWAPANSKDLDGYFALPVLVTSRGGAHRRFDAGFVEREDVLYVTDPALVVALADGTADGVWIISDGTGDRRGQPRRLRVVPLRDDSQPVRRLFEQKYGAACDVVLRLVRPHDHAGA